MIGRRGVGPPHPAGGLALCVGLASVCKKIGMCGTKSEVRTNESLVVTKNEFSD